MLEPNPLVNLPDLENVEWNYDQSVQKMRPLVVKMENIITGNDWLESYILHEWTYLIVQVEIGLDGGNI